MTIKILAFAQARETFGFSEKILDCETGITPREVMGKVNPAVSLEGLRVAVNCEFADWDEPIREAAEMALLPPVSGG